MRKVDKFCDKEHLPKIFARLNEFRKEGKYCDVKIVAGDVELLAHKVILAAFSPHLKELFLNYSANRRFVLQLNCVEASLVDILLEYIYTSKIKLSESNVSGLLHLAKFLKAVLLFESCCRYMGDTVNVQNCVAYYKLAFSYSHESLKKKSVDCIQKNITRVSCEKEFLELPTEYMGDIFAGTLHDSPLKVKDAIPRRRHSTGVRRHDSSEGVSFIPWKLTAEDYVINQAQYYYYREV